MNVQRLSIAPVPIQPWEPFYDEALILKKGDFYSHCTGKNPVHFAAEMHCLWL